MFGRAIGWFETAEGLGGCGAASKLLGVALSLSFWTGVAFIGRRGLVRATPGETLAFPLEDAVDRAVALVHAAGCTAAGVAALSAEECPTTGAKPRLLILCWFWCAGYFVRDTTRMLAKLSLPAKQSDPGGEDPVQPTMVAHHLLTLGALWADAAANHAPLLRFGAPLLLLEASTMFLHGRWINKRLGGAGWTTRACEVAFGGLFVVFRLGCFPYFVAKNLWGCECSAPCRVETQQGEYGGGEVGAVVRVALTALAILQWFWALGASRMLLRRRRACASTPEKGNEKSNQG